MFSGVVRQTIIVLIPMIVFLFIRLVWHGTRLAGYAAGQLIPVNKYQHDWYDLPSNAGGALRPAGHNRACKGHRGCGSLRPSSQRICMSGVSGHRPAPSLSGPSAAIDHRMIVVDGDDLAFAQRADRPADGLGGQP